MASEAHGTLAKPMNCPSSDASTTLGNIPR